MYRVYVRLYTPHSYVLWRHPYSFIREKCIQADLRLLGIDLYPPVTPCGSMCIWPASSLPVGQSVGVNSNKMMRLTQTRPESSRNHERIRCGLHPN